MPKWTIRLAEVQRLRFDQPHLEPIYAKEQRAIAEIADFNWAHEVFVFFEGRICAPGDSIRTHKPASPFGEIRRRLDWLKRRCGIVMVEKRSLEPNMLSCQSRLLLAVIGHKDTQVLVGQKQQESRETDRVTAMPDRSLAVVAEIEKAVGVCPGCASQVCTTCCASAASCFPSGCAHQECLRRCNGRSAGARS